MKRFFVSLLTVVTGLAGGLAVSAPAQATASDCLSGYFCIWTGYGFTGTRYRYTYEDFLNGINNGIRLTPGASNHGRSFYNHFPTSNKAVYIFDGAWCGGNLGWNRELQYGQQANAQGSDWTDRVSSIQLWNAFPLAC